MTTSETVVDPSGTRNRYTPDNITHCTCERCKLHVERVALLTGVLTGIVNALSVNPMFAGFLPAELKEQIRALG